MPPPPPSPWPHYAWAAGHVLLLVCAVKYLVSVLTFKAASNVIWYKLSYAGALISYAIVCFKAVGMPQASPAYIQRALADENVQYFILALYWFLTRPIFTSLIPFATFSAFHTLTFVRTNIIPKILPSRPAPAAQPGQPTSRPEQHPYAKAIGTWVRNNYESAMQIVAFAELVIFAWVCVGALLRRNSLLTPVIYAHFLRQRFMFSSFTRQAVNAFTTAADARINATGSPAWLQQGWAGVKVAAARWANAVPGGTPAPQPERRR
ncbi:hypothetical protein CALCODRAFT_501645 [Calocera cornea HHB12733]|uniref:Endoplasmic reticulum protein n=1 Tax=Calocera cornea HHB12733 TaxID=1353952 RepID=A0A165DJW9_9BASI|nr:hypothetical protein CALCODRAFT_501645 [Calocera cornea HHB12733]